VTPGAIALAGSAIGKITPKKHRITADIHDGDAIILLASTGVHTNGLTLCREIAARLPQGYRTPIGHGDPRTLGEALLAPSAIYVAFVRECQRRDIKLNYLVHLTGHGWRKLMRPEEPCLYEITTPRPPPPLFRFLQEAGPITQREMYATFNQGAGFAAYVAPDKIESTLAAAKATGYDAWHAGRIRKAGARKAVRIPPLDLEYTADTLALR
jgi:phosphoribosylformylglycinamidine cyclo-ligase